jgi:hypothetical protein
MQGGSETLCLPFPCHEESGSCVKCHFSTQLIPGSLHCFLLKTLVLTVMFSYYHLILELISLELFYATLISCDFEGIRDKRIFYLYIRSYQQSTPIL